MASNPYIKVTGINSGNAIYFPNGTIDVKYPIYNNVSPTTRDTFAATFNNRLPDAIYAGFGKIDITLVSSFTLTDTGAQDELSKAIIEALLINTENVLFYDDYFGAEIQVVINNIVVNRDSKSSKEGYWAKCTIKMTQVKKE